MYNKKKKKEKIHFFLQQTIESLYIYMNEFEESTIHCNWLIKKKFNYIIEIFIQYYLTQ